MAYTKQGFKDGQTLSAANLIKIEDGLIETQNAIEELGGEVYAVPSYWQDAVDACSTAIKTIQDKSGADCVQFAAIGDLHWVARSSGNYGANAGSIASYVMDKCDIPLFIALGDLAESGNAATEQYLLDDLDGAMAVLSPIGNDRLMAIRGNHDDVWGLSSSGVAYCNKLAPAKVWNKIHRPQANDFRRVFGGDGTYFYIDNVPQKTRFVALNSHFYDGPEITAGDKKMMTNGFGAVQLEWLESVALDAPDDYIVVVFLHTPPTAQPINGRTDYLGQLTDGAAFRTIITNANAEIVAIFCGHCHADAIVENDLPCPIITVTCSANIPYNSSEEERVYGTDKETAVDFVSIDKAAKRIHCTRLGVGSDRIVGYGGTSVESFSVTYNLTNATISNGATSVLKGDSYSATISAKSGYELKSVTVKMGGIDITSSAYGSGKVSVASVTGNVVVTATATEIVVPEPSDKYTNLADPTSSDWVNNSRLSSSGTAKAEGEFPGGVVTNWIECKRGDVLRFKGIELTGAYATSNTAAPYMSVIYTGGTSETVDINTYESGFPRDSNGVYTFKVLCTDGTNQSWTTNGEVARMRFSGLLSASSASGVVITKNEEIV